MKKLLLLSKAIPQSDLRAAGDRYQRLLARRTDGTTAAMAAEDARIAARVTAAVDALVDPKWSMPPPELAKTGDYYKPTMQWHGLTINIENPAGTVRTGVDEGGKPWRTEFKYAYGEIAGTLGVDHDPVDVYIGPYADAAEVYIVRQQRRKNWHEYDEDKVMIDFPSMDAAREAYLNHYDDYRFFGGIVAMPVAEFITKVKATKNKPAMIKSLYLFNLKS